jgi:hypothetical protein
MRGIPGRKISAVIFFRILLLDFFISRRFIMWAHEAYSCTCTYALSQATDGVGGGGGAIAWTRKHALLSLSISLSLSLSLFLSLTDISALCKLCHIIFKTVAHMSCLYLRKTAQFSPTSPPVLSLRASKLVFRFESLKRFYDTPKLKAWHTHARLLQR